MGWQTCCCFPWLRRADTASREALPPLPVSEATEEELAGTLGARPQVQRPSHSPFYSQGSNVMEEQDLREIGISDPQHRRKLLQAARALPKVTIHSSAAWASARARHLPTPLGSGCAGHSGCSPHPRVPEGDRGPRSQQSARN